MTGGGYSNTKVVQITNIAPQCTKDQMYVHEVQADSILLIFFYNLHFVY